MIWEFVFKFIVLFGQLASELFEFVAAAGEVYVFDAQEEFPARLARGAPDSERRKCVAEVEISGRRGREAGDEVFHACT